MQSASLHYERAFAHYLKERRVPHVCVDEARRALLPISSADDGEKQEGLKFFDYVVYGESGNLLVELKGRRVIPVRTPAGAPRPSRRLECWVTRDDVASLLRWESLFGDGFEAVLVFVYWCEGEPPAALFQNFFEFDGRWYAPRAVRVRDYQQAMRIRSPRWRTVDLAQTDFERMSGAFAPGEALAP